ncbi:MAG TPA: hypothetical protein VGJ94_10465 [Syntrophorhabdaceae bacterium]|jgi:hypothetical protein
MAEIKSAIELAMERTRNLVMDEEEKKESRKKEIENRLRATLRRYLEGMTDEERALKEVDEIDAESGLKRGLLFGLLLEELDITKEIDRLISLIDRAAGRLPGSLMEELGEIRDRFTLEMAKKEQDVRVKVMDRLAEMGVSGDGIEPNVETWEEWTHARQETGRMFEAQVNAWKERVIRAIKDA